MQHGIAAAIGALVAIGLSPLLHLGMQRSTIRQRYLSSVAHCSTCGDPLRTVQRFPLVAWLRSAFACRTCHTPIGRDTPWFEIVLVALLSIAGFLIGLELALPAYLVFVASLFAISVVDLRHYLIPNRLLYPALYACLVLMLIPAVQQPGRYGQALAAMVCSWLFFFVVYFINPRGLGFGDVRLSALNGFMTGWLAIGNAFLGILLGVFLGAISSVLLLIFRIRGRKEAIPFGPFLALGAVLAVFGPLAVG